MFLISEAMTLAYILYHYSDFGENLISKLSHVYLEGFKFFFPIFIATAVAYEVPRPGVKPKLQLEPMPLPWQHQIRTTPATYTTTDGNTGSLTL